VRAVRSGVPVEIERHLCVSADYDSPWKEALDTYFEAALALLFPAVHALNDWLMELPPALEDVFRQDMETIQREALMPYVTSIERSARRAGQREGIKSMLHLRFSDEGLALMSAIDDIHDEEKLRAILKALEIATSVDEVRRICLPGSP
jgi:hypothetical protein